MHLFPVRRKLSVIWIVCNMTDKKRKTPGVRKVLAKHTHNKACLYCRFTHVMLSCILTFISSFLLLGWKS